MSDTSTETPATEEVQPPDTPAGEGAHETSTPAKPATPSSDETEPDTFPRTVVEELRRESAKYRDRAKRADDLAHRLHTELVKATGRLADPTDLAFNADHLDDPEALTAAVDELLEAKPHLASRRPTGDIGQGQRGGSGGDFSLLGLLKERT